jgi:hypothetical protein
MEDKDLEKANRKFIRENYNKLVLQYQELQRSYLRVKSEHKNKEFKLNEELYNANYGNSNCVVEEGYYNDRCSVGKLSYFQQLSIMKCLLKTMNKKLRNYKNKLRQ